LGRQHKTQPKRARVGELACHALSHCRHVTAENTDRAPRSVESQAKQFRLAQTCFRQLSCVHSQPGRVSTFTPTNPLLVTAVHYHPHNRPTPFPLPKAILFLTCNSDMTDQSESTRFRARFESALQAYQQATGVILAEHPFTLQIQNLQSVESITAMLKHEARASSDLLGTERAMNSIESTVAMSFTLSTTAFFSDTIGMVRKVVLMVCFQTPDGSLQSYPPGKAILAGLAILFDVCSRSAVPVYVGIVVTSK
jgi:hypothetical protein